jgi:glycosyltransferase involved in cell wall biosynthesis
MSHTPHKLHTLSNKYDLSLIVACYNEETHLKESVRQTVEVLDNTSWTYEIIFIDDCSQDRTREVIDEILVQYKDKNVSKLFHERNKGRGGTVADGFRIAQGDIVGYIDIDLEVHARYIPSMVIGIRNGADVTTALRIYKVQPRLFLRFILSTGYRWLMQTMLQADLQDTETGYKFFKRAQVLSILDQVKDEGWFWDTEIMVHSLLSGFKIVEIPCLFIRRYDKKSTVNVFQDTIEYLGNLWKFRQVVREIRDSGQSSNDLNTKSKVKVLYRKRG